MNTKGQVILSNFVLLFTFLLVIFAGGIIAGIIYYDLNVLENTLKTVNFPIPIMDNSTMNNQNITDFQGILAVTVYPILGLSSSLPYLSYFMVFAFIIALSITAYVSSKNPVFFVLHILITFLVTYFAIILSNTYINLLNNSVFNQMMQNFTIYNKLMIYLPAVVFFTSLIFGAIAFVNVMKPQSNTYGNSQQLNYGGDY